MQYRDRGVVSRRDGVSPPTTPNRSHNMPNGQHAESKLDGLGDAA